MDGLQFKKVWLQLSDDNLHAPYTLKEHSHLTNETIFFLYQTGLPKDAAPFLSFDSTKDLKRITDIFNFLDSSYKRFTHIGSNSEGDPIVINTSNNDSIELLDHENNFSSTFFNSNINALASSLVAYQRFVSTVLNENGESAILNSNFTDAQYAKLRKELLFSDKNILIQKGFWMSELEILLANRENDN